MRFAIAQRRRYRVRGPAVALVGLIALAAGGWVWQAGGRKHAQIATGSTALQAYEHQARNPRVDAVDEADLPGIVPLLIASRATLGQVNDVQLVYSRIVSSAAAQRLPPWTPRDALGAAGATLFTRASGKRLDEGIPGFYTTAGFHQVLLPALARAASGVAAESWVLGQTVTIDPTGPEMQSLQSGVIASYEADFVRLWEAMLADLDVRPPRSLAQAAQGFYILGSPASPMRDLLVSIARQVTLSAPPATMDETSEQGAGGPDGVLRVAALMPVDDPPPGWEVGARFQALRDLVGTGPGAPIDRVLKTLSRLQQQLARLAVLPPGAPAPPVGRDDPAVALRIAAGTQQLPVRRWLAAMATSGASLRSSGAKEQTISVYNSANGPGPACARTINNHFPFTPTATADASLEDFGRLFGRGGWLDGFFTTQLRPYVAISSHGWRPHAVDGVPAPVSQADLDQFQRVGAIRELFFAGGSVMPSVRFDITPLGMDQGADKVILDFDGTVVTYPDGAGKATPITWPGATKMLSLKLAWDTEPGIVELGPWALFRMFAHGTIQPATAGNRFSLTFSAGEHEARFEIHTASANTPFTSAALRDFRCPNVQ